MPNILDNLLLVHSSRYSCHCCSDVHHPPHKQALFGVSWSAATAPSDIFHRIVGVLWVAAVLMKSQ